MLQRETINITGRSTSEANKHVPSSCREINIF